MRVESVNISKNLGLLATLEKRVIAELEPTTKCFQFRYKFEADELVGDTHLVASVLEYSKFSIEGLQEYQIGQVPGHIVSRWMTAMFLVPAIPVLKVNRFSLILHTLS